MIRGGFDGVTLSIYEIRNENVTYITRWRSPAVVVCFANAVKAFCSLNAKKKLLKANIREGRMGKCASIVWKLVLCLYVLKDSYVTIRQNQFKIV